MPSAMSASQMVVDVAYLLTTSLTTDDRVRHQDELLRYYLGELESYGVTLDIATARHEFARNTLQPIIMLVAASVIVERTERGDAMFLTMIRRAVDAVDEWHALEEIA